jgi:predicted phage terminase large subunit-like protein
VGGNIAGRGADLFIVDDPHSEQDALSPTALENAWEWYQGGPRQRLQPGGAIILVMTRWGENDLTARLLRQSARDPKADQWEIVEFPAIFENGEALWPEYWSLEELEKIKASINLSKWNAQYLQNPTSDTAAVIKREWWMKWNKDGVPRLHYVMQSYDTAYLKTRTSDYTAIQTWGVFYPTEESPPNVILLDAKKGKWEFPDLKRIAFEEYKYWDPEVVLIEAKAAGHPLSQELRSTGIPIANFTPSRGNDKHVRMNSVAPLFEAGLVWYPESAWAEEVIEEMAAFPNGEHDDHCDAATQALMRFRQGGFLTHPEDFVVEREDKIGRRVYY